MKKTIISVVALCISLLIVLAACAAPPAASSAPASSAAASSAPASSEPAASSAPASSAPAASSAAASESASAAPEVSTTVAGEFAVGLECAYAPYNWTQTDNSNGAVEINGGGGYAGGYDIEMAKLIAAGLNKKLVVKKTEWDGLIPACQSGVIDAIIAGMSPTAERKEQISFTNTYCKVSVGIVVKKGGKYESAKSLADFAGAKLTAQLNTFHYTVIDQITGVSKQTAMDNFPAMRVALESGIIDGYVSEKPEGISAAAANPNFAFIEFADGQGFKTSDDDTLLAIGINKKNAGLLDAANKILAGISDDQRTKLMDAAIKNQPAAK